MAFISESDRVALRQRFGALSRPVRLLVFTDRDGCRYCAQTAALVQELASLDAHLRVDVIVRAAQPDRAARYGIDKVPAIAVLAPTLSFGQARTDQTAPVDPDAGFRDTGIRFFGIPAGYEFGALVEAALAASSGGAALAPETQRWLAVLDRPVHVRVFVTPTCPYCPRAVRLAHRLALASPLITADVVEAGEFPALAERYRVMGVPRTVINETTAVEGAVPEGYLLEYLKQAAAAAQERDDGNRA